MAVLTFDVECYINYFLVRFQNHETGKHISVASLDDSPLDRKKILGIIRKHTLIGFNSLNYDMPMVSAALAGWDNAKLKKLSDAIILQGKPHWLTYREYDLQQHDVAHIDIKEPSAGVMVSLKTYGGRLNAPKLQDLPIEPSATISESDAVLLDDYCGNDNEVTWLLYQKQRKQFDLRSKMSNEYDVNLMSKSDAQVAEVVFKSELEKQRVKVKKTKLSDSYSFKFNCPKWIRFKSATLNDMLDKVNSCEFKLSDSMKPIMPDLINKAFEFNGNKYKFGIGGLHSQEKKQILKAGDDTYVFDIDVASFYPNIILGQGLYPKHLTAKFLDVYRTIVDRRVNAKHSGDKTTADSLKITINGSYGKFGSHYSFLFSPDLLIQTTLTGQLSLLMLIEAVEEVGATVKSANTDGVVVQCDHSIYQDVCDAYYQWEIETGFDLEQTDYSAVYSRDVNNYIAVKTDGEIKGKGAFAPTGLMKNPNTPICYEAVKRWLAKGVPIGETIHECDDITQFIVVRNVTGGAIWRENYLGKSVRWYYSTDGDLITYKKNGNKVPKSDGAKPMMDLLPEMPLDVDYERYLNECADILETLGC